MLRKEHGWRLYRVTDGEIGINRLRRPKFFPDWCRLNSTWMERDEAARLISETRRASA